MRSISTGFPFPKKCPYAKIGRIHRFSLTFAQHVNHMHFVVVLYTNTHNVNVHQITFHRPRQIHVYNAYKIPAQFQMYDTFRLLLLNFLNKIKPILT